MGSAQDEVDVFQRLLDALQKSGIPYMVGGSLASSLHGIPRSTNDVDIVAGIREEQVSRLVSDLAKVKDLLARLFAEEQPL